MKLRAVATAGLVTGLLTGVLGGVAEARNPNCSGGILYVTQAVGARDKQDMGEAARLWKRAVEKLNQCSHEDPNDFEALGYLGWAYAEVDSFGPAGVAFEKAIAGLTTKGDKKKVEWATDNRKSFFVRQLNEGIGKIRDAQGIYPDMTKKPETDADKTLMGEARKNFDLAIGKLRNALQLSPGEPSALRNLGIAYMLTGQDSIAEMVYKDALKSNPNDTTILQAMRAMRNDRVTNLLTQGKYGEAVTIASSLTKEEPNNPARWGLLGDSHFERAQHTKPDSAARPDYRAAGDAYAKASDLNATEHSLAYNAGLAYYNAREYAKAEPMFRRAAQAQPDNAQTASYFAATLAATKKLDEASQAFQKAMTAAPKDANVRRMLVISYNFVNNGSKAFEQNLVRKALEDGKPADNAAAIVSAAPAGSGQAKTKAAQGDPEEVYLWDLKAGDQTQKVETWFYWSKKKAFHFGANQLLGATDWSTIDFKTTAAK